MALMRARDVEAEFRKRGMERGTVYVCTVLAEQQMAQQKNIRELAEMVDQMATLMTGLVAVGENMKSAVETLNGNAQREEDMGFSTQAIDDNDVN